jgi:predicted nucleic acid-binding protein
MSQDFLRLEAVPAGAAIFVDANIFIYHFLGASPECAAFLERCAAGDVRAVTGTHIVAEVLHRLLVAEAKAKAKAINAGSLKRRVRRDSAGERGSEGVGVRHLASHPEDVRRLTDHHAAAAAIERIAGTILPLTMDVLRASQWARSRDGFLVNDSLTAAMLKAEGLAHLASNDAAFLRMEGLAVYRPGDLPRN